MDNNYKEIRERTSEKLGYIVHHRVNRTHLLFVSREKKKEKKARIIITYNSNPFKLRVFDSSMWSNVELFSWSKSRGWRSMRSRFHVHERNRSSCLKLWGGGGRIRGLPMRCWRHHRSCGASHDRCSYAKQTDSLIHAISSNFHLYYIILHYSISNPIISIIMSFEPFIYRIWMRFTITRSLNTNQINPYNYLL